MSDVGCWMFPSAPLPAASPLHAPRTTHRRSLLALDVGCRMLVVGCFPLPHSPPLPLFTQHAPRTTLGCFGAFRWLLGGLGVSANALAPPKQCNSTKHVASMFLGCSLLVLSFPLLSFPRPTPDAPPPPLDYSLQTPAAWPRLQQPPILFWHQKMPAADSNRFGLHSRRVPASTQPAAERLSHVPGPWTLDFGL